jgi:hypothetical protein
MKEHRRFGRLGVPVLGLVALVFCGSSVAHGELIVGTTPYLSHADSPFAAAPMLLETFETGGLTLTGVSLNSGWMVLGPATLTDSVDADDGAIDGSGNGGHSLYSNGNHALEVTFDASAFGGLLPKMAGVAWTDVGFVTSGIDMYGAVRLEAFDAANNSLGAVTSGILGDGAANGGTAEDRFFGVVWAGGISRFVLTMDNSTDWEVDHLQLGFQLPPAVVPEPSSLVLAVLGGGGAGLALVGRRRSRGA